MKRSLSLVLFMAFALLVGPMVCAQPASAQPTSRPVVHIWQGKAPGTEEWTYSERVTQGRGGEKTYTNVVDPTLTVFLPDPAKANGAAVIICPGGAMRMVGISDRDSTAEFLNSKGIAAFILKYRLVPDAPQAGGGGGARGGAPGGMGMGSELSFKEIVNRKGNANPAPDNATHVQIIKMAIDDGQQAIRHIRQNAEKYRIDPKKVGIMGFSAGGGVAVGTAVYESPDAYPDFVATIYGPSLCDVNVPKQGAPLFIAAMDAHFNVTNGCVALYTFWKDAGRPVELHIYDHGSGSGSGMPIANWTDRLHEWLKMRKIVAN